MQALLFGDGGILAFGANAFCMAVVMPFVGYAVYKLLNKWTKNRIIASFFGGYIGIAVAALTVAVLLGIQPILFKDSSGNPPLQSISFESDASSNGLDSPAYRLGRRIFTAVLRRSSLNVSILIILRK